MKQFLIASLAVLLSLASTAQAGLSRSAISSMNLQVFGIYVSSDPACDGLVATLPISKSAQSTNFLAAPTLGSGFVPTTVSCIVLVVKNNISLAYNSGNYTTTSSGGSDSVCNGGGTVTITPCTGSKSISWGTRLATDMNSAGLTMPSTCSGATGDEIIPIYLSSNSACTGNSTIDALLGRTGCNPNGFTPPTTSSNTSSGFLMTAASAQSAYALVVDPSESVGNVGGSCGAVANPRFGSRGGASAAAVVASQSGPSIAAVTLASGTSPAAGTTSGGTSIKVVGSNFDAGAQVTVGGTVCTSPSVNAAGTQITCTTGAQSSGVGSVVVTNPTTGLSSTSGSSFEYRAAPTITSFTPTNVPANTLQIITLNGTGFRTSTALGASAGLGGNVSIGPVVDCAPVTINSLGTQITCTARKASATSALTIRVTNSPDSQSGSSGGTAAAGFNFL